MTRRDAATVLWGAAGLLALWIGISHLLIGVGLASSSAGYRSVMSSGPSPLLSLMLLLDLFTIAGGVLVLRRRSSLARWFFPEDQPAPAAPAADSSAGETEVPPVGVAISAREVTAHHICSVAVAAIGIRAVMSALQGLSTGLEWKMTMTTDSWSFKPAVGLLAVALLAMSGGLTLWWRERIAAWMMKRDVPPTDPFAIQASGIGLLGLALILWNAPALAVLSVYFVTSGGATPEFLKGIHRNDFQSLLSILLGVVLFLGRHGLRSLRSKVRPMSEDEDLPDLSPFE